jgi:succinyl-CoA synthetase beta subunit
LDGEVLALDAKLNMDDNAAFRHPGWEDLRDPEEEDPLELEAGQQGLSYVKLDGNIGCMVNGAGLAMATMDMIKGAGGEPANFLDVGGRANEETVSHAFRIVLSDPNVRVVFINIFGGIMRCDVIARGVVNAAARMNVNVPLVVRLQGTNVDEGRRILESSGLPLTVAEGMREAAERAVERGR